MSLYMNLFYLFNNTHRDRSLQRFIVTCGKHVLRSHVSWCMQSASENSIRQRGGRDTPGAIW